MFMLIHQSPLDILPSSYHNKDLMTESAVSNIENDDAISRQKSAENLRNNLGLPHNATTQEVFAQLAKRQNLSPNSTPTEIIMSMMNDVATDMTELNNNLNELRGSRQSLLGKIASFFAFKL